jgi:hypothetical protein
MNGFKPLNHVKPMGVLQHAQPSGPWAKMKRPWRSFMTLGWCGIQPCQLTDGDLGEGFDSSDSTSIQT